MTSLGPSSDVSKSKLRRMRAAETRRRHIASACGEDAKLMMTSQLALLTYSIDSLAYFVSCLLQTNGHQAKYHSSTFSVVPSDAALGAPGAPVSVGLSNPPSEVELCDPDTPAPAKPASSTSSTQQSAGSISTSSASAWEALPTQSESGAWVTAT